VAINANNASKAAVQAGPRPEDVGHRCRQVFLAAMLAFDGDDAGQGRSLVFAPQGRAIRLIKATADVLHRLWQCQVVALGGDSAWHCSVKYDEPEWSTVIRGRVQLASQKSTEVMLSTRLTPDEFRPLPVPATLTC